MADIVLRDIDDLLADRIRRVAEANGWPLQEALMHLLEHGLFACEGALAGKLNDADTRALQSAIAALEQVPNDSGFALIGRATVAPARPPGPDQSIHAQLFDEPALAAQAREAPGRE